MKAGGLDRTVAIQRRSAAVDDGYTTQPGAWGNLAARKAMRIVSRAREVFENQGIEAEVPLTFVLRDDSVTRTVNAKDRLVFGGRAYDIKSVTEIGRRRGIEIVGVANADSDVAVDWIEGEGVSVASGADGIELVGNELRVSIDELPSA